MNIFFYLLFSLFLSLFSFCEKENDFQNKGEITGLDYRKCACWGEKCGCCGDFVIKIDDTAYLFKELPKNPKLELTVQSKFPIFILLDWIPDRDSCAKSWRYIEIQRFKLD